MSLYVTFSVILLIGFKSPGLTVKADQDLFAESGEGELKSHQKRQLADFTCHLPNPLENGFFFPHHRHCPAEARHHSTAACKLTPWTSVSVGWVLRYSCDFGFRLNTTRVASICWKLQGESGTRWVPPLPTCVESSYSSSVLPSKDICGKPSIHRTKRRAAIDGKLSKRGAWPWMVVFGRAKSSRPADGYDWFCAGTLVTTRHVLTAANCVSGLRRWPTFLVRMDDLNLNDSVKDGSEPIELTIERTNIIVYPGYQEDVVFEHNIAIVKLHREIRISNFVKPICLPTPDFADRSFTGEEAHFVSWGQNDRKRRVDPILHENTAKIIDHNVCRNNYRDFQETSTPIIISEKLICAATKANRSCKGDFGSPLMMKVRKSYYLLGIVATKDRCFDEHFPRLFTRLSSSLYMDWIISNLNNS